jgi:hypothetical protein
MKILLAADGPYTKRMLAYLAAHDEWCRRAVPVLNTVTPVPGRAAAVIDRDTLKSYYTETSEPSSNRSPASSSRASS